ncbi:TRAP transporter substrate-binding protein [Serpens gallinarum]|uniref:TRAP transporter substrate-binding protein n=1 Tax=Serpens gallinarum TaxID=2763075 RepID=A0ABR8TN96_9PSED|nr:TRAP transporter substrate-binding protein [Serpens gallinarum]MBD7977247.1 TRAP transporter substrate-binding protein [Serpens gallinarum]
MNKSGLSISLCLAAALLSACALAEPITIKFAHVVTDSTPKGQGARLFKELVEQRLGDQVRVEVYANSSLYGDADEMEALRENRVQLLAPSLAKFETYTPQLQVFDLPFLFDDLAAVDRFQRRAKGRQLLQSMADHNIVGLAYWHNGMKQLSAIRALRTPQDARDLNFRIQHSAVLEAQFQQLGAKTSKLPFSSVYTALKSGQVQGAENPWSNIYSQKFHEVQPYIIETNHGVLDYMLVSNSRFWYSIPHHIRVELEGIIDEVTYAVNQQAAELNIGYRQKIQHSGYSQVLQLSSAERQAWREAMEPVWRHFETQIGTDIIKAARAANRKPQ